MSAGESNIDYPPVKGPESLDMRLAFTGNARDYFRLWIVNLCLTLLTFGVFSAWAKVRRKRYFYSHTELGGVPFEYLGAPIPILKGRLVGAALLALWYVGTHFSLRLFLCVLGLAVVLAPWVMVRTAAFNARHSAYRNITFEFDGTYWGAAGAMLVALLRVVLTAGLGYPWAFTHVRRYFVEHTSYGGVRARYGARGGHLVRPFLAMLLGTSTMIGLGVAVAVRSGFGPTLGVGYVVYGLGYAYWEARVSAVNWRFTSLGPVRFDPRYRAKDFMLLYFTNALAVVGSLGLLIPWAAVRMYRYRLERLNVEQHGELTAFAGRPGGAVRATGAEVMDLFDFDLSL